MARKLTLQEMEAAGEIWYQRTQRLREYWQNQDNPEDKRGKALALWAKMVQLVLRTGWAMATANQPRFPEGKFRPGGISVKK